MYVLHWSTSPQGRFHAHIVQGGGGGPGDLCGPTFLVYELPIGSCAAVYILLSPCTYLVLVRYRDLLSAAHGLLKRRKSVVRQHRQRRQRLRGGEGVATADARHGARRLGRHCPLARAGVLGLASC